MGAGLAGLRACETLRQNGYEGRLRLVGDEEHLPYDRPPLSKQLLAGSWDAEHCGLTTAPRLDALGVDLELGPRAQFLDLSARRVTMSDGRSLAFDGLVIATGATPQTLAHIKGPDVVSLRTLDDALALHTVISRGGARLVIAGAGLIGLEVAATARGLGARVTVVDPFAIPLERSVGPLVGRTCESMHRGAWSGLPALDHDRERGNGGARRIRYEMPLERRDHRGSRRAARRRRRPTGDLLARGIGSRHRP